MRGRLRHPGAMQWWVGFRRRWPRATLPSIAWLRKARMSNILGGE